jgi:hypothetical protein
MLGKNIVFKHIHEPVKDKPNVLCVACFRLFALLKYFFKTSLHLHCVCREPS